MQEVRSWRELLGRIMSDSQEKQRIAEALNVNPITLVRWAENKSNPREDKLRPLLDALPQYRKQLGALITEEYPHVVIDGPPTEIDLREIPASFYAQALRTYTTSLPILRSSAVCTLILQQILEHLDPHLLGMIAGIIQCVPPAPGQKVRSLRSTLGRGTASWQNYTGTYTVFLGAESQSGSAVSTGHPIVVQSHEEKVRLYPTHHFRLEESSAAYPILLSNRIAGCLCVSSTQPDYFSPDHLNLIQGYVDLVALTFNDDEFFDLGSIELGVMPPRDLQRPRIAHFQQRVIQRMIQLLPGGRFLRRPEAELLVWQDLEEELLQIAREL